MTVPAYTNTAHFRAPYKNVYFSGFGQEGESQMPENAEQVLGSEKVGNLTVLGYDAAVHTMNQLDNVTIPYILQRSDRLTYHSEWVVATVPEIAQPLEYKGWASKSVEMGNAIIYAPNAQIPDPTLSGQSYIVTTDPLIVASNVVHDGAVVVAGPPDLIAMANALAGGLVPKVVPPVTIPPAPDPGGQAQGGGIAVEPAPPVVVAAAKAAQPGESMAMIWGKRIAVSAVAAGAVVLGYRWIKGRKSAPATLRSPGAFGRI